MLNYCKRQAFEFASSIWWIRITLGGTCLKLLHYVLRFSWNFCSVDFCQMWKYTHICREHVPLYVWKECNCLTYFDLVFDIEGWNSKAEMANNSKTPNSAHMKMFSKLNYNSRHDSKDAWVMVGWPVLFGLKESWWNVTLGTVSRSFCSSPNLFF